MIHLMIGNGRGKTTSAVGLAIRAAGHGQTVLFLQFLKDDSSGEITILREIPNIIVCHPTINYGFTFQMTEDQLKKTSAEYEKMIRYAMNTDAFLVVLDESMHALKAGLIKREELEKMFGKEREYILTGYEAPDWLIERADYISKVEKIKHPFDKGMQAREGVEF